MARTGDEKIALMYAEYGKFGGCRCRSCPHLEAHVNVDCTRVWYKCLMYGKSSGEATDWRCSNEACGAFIIAPEDAKKKHLYGEVFRRNKGLRAKLPTPQISGQVAMDLG